MINQQVVSEKNTGVVVGSAVVGRFYRFRSPDEAVREYEVR